MEPVVPVVADGGDRNTIGDWQTEGESASALDRRLLSCGLWEIHREVCGTLLQPRHGQVDKAVRIDRVLVPGGALLESGWRLGAIGIEVKRSGVKIGPPLAQALDYTRSAWTLGNGVTLLLGAVFLWPMSKQHGPIASVMAQNRVGSASFSPWSLLYLQLGEETAINVRFDGEVHLGNGTAGRKVGSR